MEGVREPPAMPAPTPSSQEDMFKAMMQQKSMLDTLAQMQFEIQSMVESQRSELERQLQEQGFAAEDCKTPFYQKPAGWNHMVPKQHEAQNQPGQGDVPAEVPEDTSFERAGSKNSSGEKGHKRNNIINTTITSPNGATSKEAAKDENKGLLDRVLSSTYFEGAMAVAILLNFAMTFIELQWKGYDLAYSLGQSADDGGWSDVKFFFMVAEKLFNAIFVAELIMHLVNCHDRYYCQDTLHFVDMVTIVISATQSFILDPMDSLQGTRAVAVMRVLKVVRALRLLRFIRLLRFMEAFSALRVIVKTVEQSVGSLVWSMAIVGFIIVAAGMFMSQATQQFIEDSDSYSTAIREKVFEYYGSSFRASWSMFICTFTSRWTVYAEPLVEDVHPLWAIFWILWTISVNFAVIRICSALFLKQTLDVAAVDATRVASVKMKERDNFLSTVREVFHMCDTAGDGVLHRSEFEAMLENEEAMAALEPLELEMPELMMLYNVMAEEDDMADEEEFLAGALKLKMQVRTVDIIQILHEQLCVKRDLAVLADGVHQIDKVLHPKNPWKKPENWALSHHNVKNRKGSDSSPQPASPMSSPVKVEMASSSEICPAEGTSLSRDRL